MLHLELMPDDNNDGVMAIGPAHISLHDVMIDYQEMRDLAYTNVSRAKAAQGVMALLIPWERRIQPPDLLPLWNRVWSLAGHEQGHKMTPLRELGLSYWGCYCTVCSPLVAGYVKATAIELLRADLYILAGDLRQCPGAKKDNDKNRVINGFLHADGRRVGVDTDQWWQWLDQRHPFSFIDDKIGHCHFNFDSDSNRWRAYRRMIGGRIKSESFKDKPTLITLQDKAYTLTCDYLRAFYKRKFAPMVSNIVNQVMNL
jgi:hypothetical protein